jgi:Holliday junction resolvase RusA-like endonuclease
MADARFPNPARQDLEKSTEGVEVIELGQTFVFAVPGEPVQWQRARGTGANRFNTPEHKAYKRQVSLAAWAAGARAPKALAAWIPIRLTVEVYLPLPNPLTDHEAALRSAGQLFPVGTPDLDNWIKLPMDALNKLVWTDDCQVVRFGPTTGKYYSTMPRLVVEVERLA